MPSNPIIGSFDFLEFAIDHQNVILINLVLNHQVGLSIFLFV